MSKIQIHLDAFKQSLCREIDVRSLFQRNSVAHKWKAPWRLLLLREATAWRLCELIQQSLDLSLAGSTLGARILLRSAFETLALLIYSAYTMRAVVAGSTDFHEFSTKTSQLLLGSRNKSTSFESVNILTVLRTADKRYSGLESWYATLCETAHPNYDGMINGYSVSNSEAYVTRFASRWTSLYGQLHDSSLEACLFVFDAEYNHEWPDAFESLERWIELNDAKLEASKP